MGFKWQIQVSCLARLFLIENKKDPVGIQQLLIFFWKVFVKGGTQFHCKRWPNKEVEYEIVIQNLIPVKGDTGKE